MGEDVLRRQLSLPLQGRQPHGLHGLRRRGLVQGPLHVGELPQPRQQSRVRTAAQGGLPVPQQDEHRLLLRPAGLFRLLHRQDLCRAPEPPQAELRRRTVPALRRAVGHADGGPQLHGCLIEDPDVRRRLRHNILHLRPDGLFRLRVHDIVMAVGDAGDHPQDVAVHRRHPQAEGRRGDSPGGVLADARQGQQRVVVRREPPSVLLRHQTGALLKIPGAAVVAQALPQLHQLVLGRRRQSLHRREGPQKAGVVPQHRRHPGLLEHDLRHPDAVRVRGPAPGQIPGIASEPSQKRLRQAL